MQQVRCVRAHGSAVPGDVAEVPDGAAVSERYWEVVPPAAPAVPAPKPAAAAAGAKDGA